MTKKGAARIPEKKKEEVKDVIRLVKEYPIFGVVDMENLPALQLQRMRQKLKDTIFIKMTKKRLFKIAFEQLKKEKPNMDKVIESMRGMPALVFTRENPFKLYKILDQNKSQAPAKAGQTAPNDIIIPAGPTQFTPGPIISELAQVGIKTKVEDGKLAVVSDVTIVKEGDQITADQADILGRFGLEPMEVGLNIVIIYENGTIYDKSILAIDEKEYIADIKKACSETLALSMEIGYITPDNIVMMLQKAYRDSKALEDSTEIITDNNVRKWVGEANLEMEAIRKVANIVDSLEKEESPEEKSKEETTETKKTIEEDKKEEEAKKKQGDNS